MGVESENAAVQLFGYVEVVGLFDQPLEQRAAALQPLGMPLHTHHRLVLGALHAFDDTVGRTGHHTETLAGVADGLMVERVDINLPLAKQLEQGGIFFDGDAVGQLLTGGILRVSDAHILAQPLIVGDVLRHLATQGHGQCLHATADAEDGYLTVEGQLGDEQFGQVARGIDAMQLGRRLVAAPQRVVVGATAEQQAVQAVERIDEHILVVDRRNDDRGSPGGHHTLVVAVAQGGIALYEVGRDADDRLAAGLGISIINVRQMRR